MDGTYRAGLEMPPDPTEAQPTGTVRVAHPPPTQPSNDLHGRSHAGGWGKALVVGLFAGVPTALFHQLSFLQTLKKRGEPIRGWAPGGSHLIGRGIPGIVPAVLRDVCYLTATQKQVQNSDASAGEAALCWALVVGAPIFFDTLSVKAVSPGYRRPQVTSLRGAVNVLRYGCPPEAVLGRLMWVPFYNLAYVTVQHQIGDADRTHETFGLVLGSFTASLVAYPAFMFKSVATAINPTTCSPIVNASLFTLGFFRRTALLLDQCEKDRSASESRRRPPWSSLRGSLARTFGYRSTTELWDTLLRKGGPITVLRRGFAGVGAHTVGNFGPDVLCMGFGRAAYMFLLLRGLAPSPHTDLPWQ